MSSILFNYLLPLVHVLACLFLIVVVLLQTGKGADMGAVLGGGSQTLFGASGAGNLLTKLTTGMAITFMATSLVIAVGQRQRPSSSLLNRLPETPPAAAPIDVPPPAPNAAADVPGAPVDVPAEPAQQADAAAPPATPPVADAKPADAPGATPPPAGAPTETPPPPAP